MSPLGRYWGQGYTNCELPHAKPEIALVLPSLNFKASSFSAAVVTLQWSRACRLGGPPYASIPWAREQPHPSFWGEEGKWGKDRADKYTLASPNSPLEKVNYIWAQCACTRQSVSTVHHRLTLPSPSWLQVLILALSLPSPNSQLFPPISIFHSLFLWVLYTGLICLFISWIYEKYKVLLPHFFSIWLC